MPENPTDIVQFVPTDDEPLFAEDALAALQDQLDPSQAPDLIVSKATPVPLGRSPAFDFSTKRFDRRPGSKGPAWTTGDGTLKGWIEKCLMTARGAHPIHPPGYGLVRPQDIIGGPVTEPPADLAQRITDALTFHPRIASVRDFAFAFDPDDEYLAVGFTVITDRDEQLPVETTLTF